MKACVFSRAYMLFFQFGVDGVLTGDEETLLSANTPLRGFVRGMSWESMRYPQSSERCEPLITPLSVALSNGARGERTFYSDRDHEAICFIMRHSRGIVVRYFILDAVD